MNSIELCPCCGSDDAGAAYDGFWTVECGNCGAVGPSGETRGEAIDRWNEESRRDWDLLRPQREALGE